MTGGHTANLLTVWRAHRVDVVLREAWERGIALAGLCAGSMCWFESGVTARAFGLPWSIAGGGFLTIVVAGSFAVLFPSLRRVDTFTELDPQRDRPKVSRSDD